MPPVTLLRSTTPPLSVSPAGLPWVRCDRLTGTVSIESLVDSVTATDDSVGYDSVPPTPGCHPAQRHLSPSCDSRECQTDGTSHTLYERNIRMLQAEIDECDLRLEESNHRVRTLEGSLLQEERAHEYDVSQLKTCLEEQQVRHERSIAEEKDHLMKLELLMLSLSSHTADIVREEALEVLQKRRERLDAVDPKVLDTWLEGRLIHEGPPRKPAMAKEASCSCSIM